jgi:hypothetical protein
MKYGGYANEKLTASVESLATGAGRVQERLRDAWEQFRRLKSTDLPPNLWRELQKINARVTDVPPELDSPRAREEGSATIAFESLSDDEACEFARILYRLQFEAAELYRAGLPPNLR